MPAIPAPTALTAGVYFAPNNVRPTWPTLDEVLRWVKSINDYPGLTDGPGPNVENLQLCLDVAVERISKRTNYQVRPVDSDGAVDPGGAPVEIPAGVKLATIIQAAKWARRPLSPDGVLGASEVVTVRALAFDPDVETMLADWQELPY